MITTINELKLELQYIDINRCHCSSHDILYEHFALQWTARTSCEENTHDYSTLFYYIFKVKILLYCAKVLISEQAVLVSWFKDIVSLYIISLESLLTVIIMHVN